MTAGEKWDIALTIACAIMFLLVAACLIVEANKAAQAVHARRSPDPVVAHAVAVEHALIERDPEEVLQAACRAICDNGDAYDNDYHPVRLCDEVLIFYTKRSCYTE